jgi:hypothetical protein
VLPDVDEGGVAEGDVLVGVDADVEADADADGDVDADDGADDAGDGEADGLGDADRVGEVDVYPDVEGDALAGADPAREADGEADAPGVVCPAVAGAAGEDVTAAGRDWIGVGGDSVKELRAKAAAPDAPSSAPMIQASTSGRSSRRRGRFPPPGGG